MAEPRSRIFKYTLFLLIILHMLNVFFWLQLNVWPMGKAVDMHLSSFVKWAQAVEHCPDAATFLFVNVEIPPFFYWVAMLLKSYAQSYRGIFCAPMVFWVILVLSVYGIGKRLKNRETGLIASIFCAFFPIIYKGSIIFNLEMATTAGVSAIIYVLLLSNNFSHRGYALLLGVSLGIGLLIRAFVPLFVVGPFLVSWFYQKNDTQMLRLSASKERLINVFLIAGIATLIAAIFYCRMETFSVLAHRLIAEDKVSEKNIITFAHLTFYAKALPMQVGGMVSLLFLAGFVCLMFEKGFEKAILFSWLVPAFLTMTFIVKKNESYSMSYIPAVGLIIAVVLQKIKPVWIKKLVVLSIVVLSMCQYFKYF